VDVVRVEPQREVRIVSPGAPHEADPERLEAQERVRRRAVPLEVVRLLEPERRAVEGDGAVDVLDG
jgi:hypothetical protein